MKRTVQRYSLTRLRTFSIPKNAIVFGILCVVLLHQLVVSNAQSPEDIKSVQKLGAVKNVAASQPLYRDGASSIRLGNKILWFFGDTLFTQKSVDGTNARTNTAAWADPSSPFKLSEPLDANGAPGQFIPYNASEAAYNAASRDPNDRYVIWPTSAISIDDNTAYLYYMRLKSGVNPSTLTGIGIGLASVSSGATSATIINESLFSANEAQYRPAAVKGDMVYLQDCQQSGFISNCAMARVAKGQMATRNAYQFWDGRVWQSNIATASHTVLGSPSTMAIMWSDYLQKFVMLSASAFSKDLIMKTADEIQGPWSSDKLAYTDATSKYPTIAYFHPELSTDGGQTLVFSVSENYDSLSSANDGIVAFGLTLGDKPIVGTQTTVTSSGSQGSSASKPPVPVGIVASNPVATNKESDQALWPSNSSNTSGGTASIPKSNISRLVASYWLSAVILAGFIMVSAGLYALRRHLRK